MAVTVRAERAAEGEESLSVLMVASEAYPFASTGGLAEVVGGLSHALARLGHTVTFVIPRYRGVEPARAAGESIPLTFGRRTQHVSFSRHELAPRVTAVLVDAPELFQRDGLYADARGEYLDNAWRFAVLSRSALEYARLGARPSIIHAHDWQTGLVPVFQKKMFSNDPVIGEVPALFTIHNIAFQGVFPSSTIDDIGLDWELFNTQALEFWGDVSYLKGGINFSEKISTVSPTYAREILGPEMGYGFQGIIGQRAEELTGILNGIDTERWNPEADPLVPARFSADDLAGKTAAKKALLDAVNLDSDAPALARPVIGVVSRLTYQKGFDLFAAAADDLVALDATWVMLGDGDGEYENLWRALASRYPLKFSATIGFEERLAHLIQAGSDMFLMPSRYEPCGLNQLYSLRYGTVPVVRATGGLQDTVRDPEEATPGTGFKFREYHPAALVAALHRALDTWRDGAQWTRMQQAGMREDHSWDASAREYVKVYRAMKNG